MCLGGLVGGWGDWENVDYNHTINYDLRDKKANKLYVL